MNVRNLSIAAVSVACSLVLASCGGSTDDGAGSPVAFSVAPNTKTVNVSVAAATDPCGTGYVGDFLIVGGTAPYRLFLSDPDVVSLNTTLVTNRNGIFSVTFISPTCLDPSSVTVMDALGNVTTLILKNTKTVVTP